MALPIESTYNRLAGLGHWMMTLAGHTLRAGPACHGQQRRLLPGQKNQARNIMTPIMGALRISLEGKVVQVVLGDIMAHVDVRIGKSQIESVITRRSAEQLGLKKWRQG